ncbi:MAG TPA: hypothetical protein DCM28_10310 [Phycisphaerales bacterium]|nr:hypothetical protein [Phycisphaerales bacterium]HCD32472.1 hypothetical protein [Phycisphaerales bacterium]|tara:strand:- start:559 stop:1650 length:1092 start_codon:yes stop_codon:yes gene_type:complete
MVNQSKRVLYALRSRIIRGEYVPGSRLPSFTELEKQYRAGRTVIQQAISELKADGFVTSRPRQGLYIHPLPPHLGRYALVFPCLPNHPQWSGFHSAIWQEAQRLEKSNSHIHFDFYHGINDERLGGKVLASVLKQVESQRMAGLILLPETHDVAEHATVTASRIPMVIVDGDYGKTPRPQICTDMSMMFKRALHWFKHKGRKRVAMVCMADTFTWLTPSHFQQNEITYRKAWVQRIGRSHPQTIDAVIHLLMDYPPGKRPDGLFIADDNLAPLTLEALSQLGHEIGKDLDVVVHSNWPCPVKCTLPIERIGFHSGQLLRGCLDVLSTANHQLARDKVMRIPAYLSSEIKQEDWKSAELPFDLL